MVRGRATGFSRTFRAASEVEGRANFPTNTPAQGGLRRPGLALSHFWVPGSEERAALPRMPGHRDDGKLRIEESAVWGRRPFGDVRSPRARSPRHRSMGGVPAQEFLQRAVLAGPFLEGFRSGRLPHLLAALHRAPSDSDPPRGPSDG